MTAAAAVRPLSPSLHLDEPIDPRGLGGLVAAGLDGEVALPLQEVRVRASVAGDCCRTVIEQRFANTLDVPMEAVHIFPLPHEGAVTEVELRCGETVVRAECRERAEAEAVFEAARQEGHRAALLTAERDDVHTLRVTNLPPGEEVSVRVVVVERLTSSDGCFRWRFPTTIPPRYLPGEPIGHDGPGVLPDSTAAPDASRLQPPLRLEGGTRLDLEVQITGALSTLESSLHAVRLQLDDGIRVAPSGTATLNKDFVLSFSTAHDSDVAVRAWTDGEHTLVVVQPPAIELPEALLRDAVFVVDISGSMSGTKMEAAKSALHAALHGLLPGDRFSLIAFDTRVECFAPEPTAYDERSLARADRWISALQPRGGTEMLAPIKQALAGQTPAGRLRTVLFITDGQAWNEAELVAAVANRSGTSRFFTLGIDTAVNASLLSKLADVGGGTCELAAPGDDVEEVITRLEARFGSPVLDEVVVEGFSSARMRKGVLFAGRPAALLVEGSPEQVTVCGRGASGPVRLEGRPQRTELPLGALWARARVAGLQERLVLKPFEEEALRPEIVRVALAHSIASKFTAFVAVERSQSLQGERVEVVQPSELPEQWSESFRPCAAPPTPPMCSAVPGGAAMPSRAPMPVSMPMPASAGFASIPPPQRRKRASRSKARSAGIAQAIGGAIDALGGLFASGGRSDSDESLATPTPSHTRDELHSFERERGAHQAEAAASSEPAGVLARTQGADGSFGGDVGRTAAALVALLLLGHTRRKGLRRRTVLKAARWLGAQSERAEAALALSILAAAERGDDPRQAADVHTLVADSDEGRLLERLLAEG